MAEPTKVSLCEIPVVDPTKALREANEGAQRQFARIKKAGVAGVGNMTEPTKQEIDAGLPFVRVAFELAHEKDHKLGDEVARQLVLDILRAASRVSAQALAAERPVVTEERVQVACAAYKNNLAARFQIGVAVDPYAMKVALTAALAHKED